MGYKRAKERNRRFRKIYKERKSRIMDGVYYDDSRGYYHQWEIGRAGGLTVQVKRLSNRKFRRNNKLLETRNKGLNHKYFEYWWSIF